MTAQVEYETLVHHAAFACVRDLITNSGHAPQKLISDLADVFDDRDKESVILDVAAVLVSVAALGLLSSEGSAEGALAKLTASENELDEKFEAAMIIEGFRAALERRDTEPTA